VSNQQKHSGNREYKLLDKRRFHGRGYLERSQNYPIWFYPIPPSAITILQHLLTYGPHHGYGIHQITGLTDKTTYVSLKKLIADHFFPLLIKQDITDTARNKSVYSLTFDGLWVALVSSEGEALNVDNIIKHWSHVMPNIFGHWHHFRRVNLADIVMTFLIQEMKVNLIYLERVSPVYGDAKVEEMLLEGLIYRMEELTENSDIMKKWIQVLQSNQQLLNIAIQYHQRIRQFHNRAVEYFDKELQFYKKLGDSNSDLQELLEYSKKMYPEIDSSFVQIL
jgi:hypothetical protein